MITATIWLQNGRIFDISIDDWVSDIPSHVWFHVRMTLRFDGIYEIVRVVERCKIND